MKCEYELLIRRLSFFCLSLSLSLSFLSSLSLPSLAEETDRLSRACEVASSEKTGSVHCQTHSHSGCDRRREESEREESSLGNLVTVGLERRSHRVSGAQAAATGISRK